MIFPSPENILLFITAATILIVVPGPAVLYIMMKSMEQGYKAGLVSVLGVGLGAMIHVIAAAVGISALLVASATAFSILKYGGAIYLIYLGIKKLTDKVTPIVSIQAEKKSLSKIFYEGIIVNTLSPKSAIFFFAFLPQFINADRGGTTSQILFLGLVFLVIAFVSDMCYVLLSGKIVKYFKSSIRFINIQKYLSATIYITLGLLTLMVNKPDSFGRTR
ncbi:Threonine/homoserine/homoserine lactone efflux protein [Reichenbachiella faecimaris]|uniref:Threonine/homoserine/homoserine lactone efflux protein n=1 Tax=Reichenbachiella faecimaris TaxID=692418 RepID=A0A1W2GN61_REIFA|nr:LysE family translocator [Reichenbachiella faecimaris]SMD38095.1 Threonine/homoserine/homoserine lactone efflux protein [Reichenbachiella faecimaris]